MKHVQQVNFLGFAMLTVMVPALALSLLHITSSIFPESAANKFYSSLSFSAASTKAIRNTESMPILFIIRNSDEDVKLINIPKIDTNPVKPEIYLNDTYGKVFRI